jgi:DNA polymerase III delta prime subunit
MSLPIHESIFIRLDHFISQQKIPHIIFHGPSGSGKLTIVRKFIQNIYADDPTKIKTHVLTVNCSHGKGIQFIREELKFFAKANKQKHSGSDFKIILLLNAHHLTVDAQSALRRCIELFSHNTRFFIVVENKNKLLNPILSRFCDIHIPEPVIPGFDTKTINLHKYNLSLQFTDSIIKSSCDFNELKDSDPKKRMELVHSYYERGISCLDLMDWLLTVDPKLHSQAVMRFHEIKPQFRCEKLLMLSMVEFCL